MVVLWGGTLKPQLKFLVLNKTVLRWRGILPTVKVSFGWVYWLINYRPIIFFKHSPTCSISHIAKHGLMISNYRFVSVSHRCDISKTTISTFSWTFRLKHEFTGFSRTQSRVYEDFTWVFSKKFDDVEGSCNENTSSTEDLNPTPFFFRINLVLHTILPFGVNTRIHGNVYPSRDVWLSKFYLSRNCAFWNGLW